MTAVDSADRRRAGENDVPWRAALNNLTTWWLEPSERQDTFRITYSYVFDASLKEHQVDVQFALPDEVTIKAKPLK